MFWAQVSASAGVIVLFAIDLILKFGPDSLKKWWEANSFLRNLVAMLATYVAPQLVLVITDKFPTVDAGLWSAIYFAGAYVVHEILYRLIQKPAVLRFKIAAKIAE